MFVLAQVRQTMHIRADYSYHVNLGIDRANIAWICRRMQGGKSDLNALDFLVPPDAFDDEFFELAQTMVYFDNINLSMEALKHLRSLLPDSRKGEIATYSSRRTARVKRRVMEDFRRGKIKILLTTEAAGMVCYQWGHHSAFNSFYRVAICPTLSKWYSSWCRRRSPFGCSVPAVLGEPSQLLHAQYFWFSQVFSRR